MALQTKIKNSQVMNTVAELNKGGWKTIRRGWESEFGRPYQAEMAKAWDLQSQRVARLHAESAKGNKYAQRAIEDIMSGNVNFIDPNTHTDPLDAKMAAETRKVLAGVANLAGSGRSGLPATLAAEYIHSMSDFPTLTQSCANRRLQKMFDPTACDDTCFDRIFFNAPARPYCDDSGLVGIIPRKAPNGAGCAHGAGCDCSPNFWQFTEIQRGHDWSKLMTDSIAWSWDLGQCSQYGGLDDIFFDALIGIINKRKQSLDVSMFFTDGELSGDIFNNDHQNIVVAPDGTCNPLVKCAADAKYVLETFAKQWAYHTDLEGNRTCNRPLVLITADKDVECAFNQALTASITETKILEGSECATEIQITADGCFPDITICYSNVMRDALGDEGSKGKFIIAPEAGSGPTDQNVARRYSVQGFEGIELVQRVGMWQDLSGRLQQGFGHNYCWDQEFMAISSYGAGYDYPEFVFASDGSEACPDGYVSDFGESILAESAKAKAAAEAEAKAKAAAEAEEAKE